MITKITKKHLIALSFIICHLAYSSIMTSCSDDFFEKITPKKAKNSRMMLLF